MGDLQAQWRLLGRRDLYNTLVKINHIVRRQYWLTSHRNPIQGPTAQKLWKGSAKARAQLEYDEQAQVDNHRPLASVSIREDTEDDCADRSKHQSYCHALVENEISTVQGTFPFHVLTHDTSE